MLRTMLRSAILTSVARHLELEEGRRTILGPPQSAADADQVFREDPPVIRAASHVDIAVGAHLVATLAPIGGRGDLEVAEAARHGRDVGDRGRYVWIGQVLQHALAPDQVVFLAVTPAGDVSKLKAVLLAHGLADFGSRVLN